MRKKVCLILIVVLILLCIEPGIGDTNTNVRENQGHPDIPISATVLTYTDAMTAGITGEKLQNYSLLIPFKPTRSGTIPDEIKKSLESGDRLYYMRAMPPFVAYHAINPANTSDNVDESGEVTTSASCRYGDLAKDADEEGMILMIPPTSAITDDILFGSSYGHEGFIIRREPTDSDNSEGILFSEKSFTKQSDFVDYLNETAPVGEDEPAFVFLDPVMTNWDGIIIDQNDPDEFWSFGWERNWGNTSGQ